MLGEGYALMPMQRCRLSQDAEHDAFVSYQSSRPHHVSVPCSLIRYDMTT